MFQDSFLSRLALLGQHLGFQYSKDNRTRFQKGQQCVRCRSDLVYLLHQLVFFLRRYRKSWRFIVSLGESLAAASGSALIPKHVQPALGLQEKEWKTSASFPPPVFRKQLCAVERGQNGFQRLLRGWYIAPAAAVLLICCQVFAKACIASSPTVYGEKSLYIQNTGTRWNLHKHLHLRLSSQALLNKSHKIAWPYLTLLNSFLKNFPRSELDVLRRCDLNLFSCARIATFSCGSLNNPKAPKTYEWNRISLLQTGSNSLKDSANGFPCRFFGDICLLWNECQ